MQDSVIMTTTISEELIPGLTLDFAYPAGVTADDLQAGQTVYIEVYSRQFTDLIASFMPDHAGVLWPSDAPYPLPPGEYAVSFQTTAPQDFPVDVGQAANVAHVTLVAQEVAADADLATLTAAYNGAVAAHDELATQFNALLTNLEAAGLMAGPPVVVKKAKAKK